MGIKRIKKDNIDWFLVPDQVEAAKILGQGISADMADEDGKPVLLLISGGSALSVLDYIQAKDWSKVTIMFLDERFSNDNIDSNFAQLTQLDWWKKAVGKGASFIDSQVKPGENIEVFTFRLADELNNWLAINPMAKKLALMGMGPDGHVAGIFPYPEDSNLFDRLFTGKDLIVSHSVYGKNKFPWRATTTYSFFALLNKSYIFVCGEEKRKALKQLWEKELPKHEFPAGIFYNIKEVLLVTDIDLRK